MIENWRAIPGYPGYEVSDLGRVRSVDRMILSEGDSRRGPYQRRLKGVMLRPWIDTGGYPGCPPFGRIHVAVMLAFVGRCPDGFEVRHRDGDPLNNRLDNLSYGTHSQNVMDRVEHGTSNRGERHGMAKLTKETVLAIKLDQTLTNRELAQRHRTTDANVRHIKAGRRWAWL